MPNVCVTHEISDLKMDLLLWQVTFSVAIFLTIITCCLLPSGILRIINKNGTEVSTFQLRVFGWLNCLTGGVFLAMCFLSLLPNVQEHFTLAMTSENADNHEHKNTYTDLPIAECVVLTGFFIVLTIEQLSRQCTLMRNSSACTSRLVEMDALIRDRLDDEAHQTLLNDDDIGFEIRNQQTSNRVKKTHGHHDHAIELLETSSKGFKFIFLLFAVVAHAFFEGIVLGVQDNVPKAVRLFVAILVHEAVVAIILGFNITKTKHRICKVFMYSLMFAITIPAGIWIGVAVGQIPGSAGHYVSGVLQGLAAGMFLHIIFMQMLPEEFDKHEDGLLKTLFLFIGFLILLLLNVSMGAHH
ncbi:hypothetical protein CHUAL_013817 [Chamberlinius hualienensis]